MFKAYREHGINRLNPIKYWGNDITFIPVKVIRNNRVKEYHCKFYSFGRLAKLYFSEFKYDCTIDIDFNAL